MSSGPPSSTSDTTDACRARDALRREMRAQRRALSLSVRKNAARSIARILSRRFIFKPGRRIAAYLPHRGEVDLASAIAIARSRGCEIYLPYVTSADAGLMRFVRFETRGRLRRNRFGILEPDHRPDDRISVHSLDVVLLPLVAVDRRGWRIGSGAGFYDRALHHLRADRRWRRPKLIGIAYEFQLVPRIEPQPWDIPLDAVVTERGVHPVNRHRT